MPSWSISTEWWIYLVFPFLVRPLRDAGPLRLGLVAVTCLATYLAIMFYLVPRVTVPPAMADQRWSTRRVTRSTSLTSTVSSRCAAGFVLGMLAHRAYAAGRWRSWLAGGPALLVLATAAAISMHYGFPDPVTVAFFPLLVLSAACGGRAVDAVLGARPLRRLGEWSYAIYMIHIPLMQTLFLLLMAGAIPEPASDGQLGLLFLGLCDGDGRPLRAGPPPRRASAKRQCEALARRAGDHALLKRFSLRWGLAGAVQVLWKHPADSLLVIVNLSLGIAGTTVVFSVMSAALIRSVALPDIDRLVMVWMQNRSLNYPQFYFSVPDLKDLKSRTKAFEAVTPYGLGDVTLSETPYAQALICGWVGPGVLQLLGAKPHLGRLFLDEDSEPGRNSVVILSHALWQQRFGSRPDLIGTSLTINRQPHTVIGVAAPGFDKPLSINIDGSIAPLKPDVWIPLDLARARIRKLRPERSIDASLARAGQAERRGVIRPRPGRRDEPSACSWVKNTRARTGVGHHTDVSPGTDSSRCAHPSMAVDGRRFVCPVDWMCQCGQPPARESRGSRRRNDAASRTGRQPRRHRRVTVG